MSNDIIQAQYDQLEQIAARFGRQAEATAQMQGRVQQSLRSLQAGGWEGRGAAAFFGEMNSTVLPSLGRLGAALQQSQYAMKQIVQVLCTSEEEAAQPFRGVKAETPHQIGAVTSQSNIASINGLPSIAGALVGFGSGLWYATIFQNKPDFVITTLGGRAKLLRLEMPVSVF